MNNRVRFYHEVEDGDVPLGDEAEVVFFKAVLHCYTRDLECLVYDSDHADFNQLSDDDTNSIVFSRVFGKRLPEPDYDVPYKGEFESSGKSSWATVDAWLTVVYTPFDPLRDSVVYEGQRYARVIVLNGCKDSDVLLLLLALDGTVVKCTQDDSLGKVKTVREAAVKLRSATDDSLLDEFNQRCGGVIPCVLIV